VVAGSLSAWRRVKRCDPARIDDFAGSRVLHRRIGDRGPDEALLAVDGSPCTQRALADA
jgi:hypothetical protein